MGKQQKLLTMPNHLLRTIRDEHHSLAVMLDALQMVIKRGPGAAPDRFFEIVRTMLVYLKEFSEHVHYPKESQLIFPTVVRAASDTAHAVIQLEQAHRQSVDALGTLQALLADWQENGPAQRLRFERAARQFCADYLAQIRVEEVTVLPVAEQLVSDAQWDALAKRYQPATKPAYSAASNESSYELMYNRIALWLTRFLAPTGLVQK